MALGPPQLPGTQQGWDAQARRVPAGSAGPLGRRAAALRAACSGGRCPSAPRSPSTGWGCGEPPPQVGSAARGSGAPGARPAAEGERTGRGTEGGAEGGRSERAGGKEEERGGSPGRPRPPRRSAPERAAAAPRRPRPRPLRRPPMARPLPLLLCLAALGAGCRAGTQPAGTAGPSAEPLQDEADNQENILSQVPGDCGTAALGTAGRGAGWCCGLGVLGRAGCS